MLVALTLVAVAATAAAASAASSAAASAASVSMPTTHDEALACDDSSACLACVRVPSPSNKFLALLYMRGKSQSNARKLQARLYAAVGSRNDIVMFYSFGDNGIHSFGS